jgi:hypothetical protein
MPRRNIIGRFDDQNLNHFDYIIDRKTYAFGGTKPDWYSMTLNAEWVTINPKLLGMD